MIMPWISLLMSDLTKCQVKMSWQGKYAGFYLYTELLKPFLQ